MGLEPYIHKSGICLSLPKCFWFSPLPRRQAPHCQHWQRMSLPFPHMQKRCSETASAHCASGPSGFWDSFEGDESCFWAACFAGGGRQAETYWTMTMLMVIISIFLTSKQGYFLHRSWDMSAAGFELKNWQIGENNWQIGEKNRRGTRNALWANDRQVTL